MLYNIITSGLYSANWYSDIKLCCLTASLSCDALVRLKASYAVTPSINNVIRTSYSPGHPLLLEAVDSSKVKVTRHKMWRCCLYGLWEPSNIVSWLTGFGAGVYKTEYLTGQTLRRSRRRNASYFEAQEEV